MLNLISFQISDMVLEKAKTLLLTFHDQGEISISPLVQVFFFLFLIHIKKYLKIFRENLFSLKYPRKLQNK